MKINGKFVENIIPIKIVFQRQMNGIYYVKNKLAEKPIITGNIDIKESYTEI